ncbi:sulfite oxidase [Bacillus sp. B15-48]|uniref:sulfite oxidase n=1 Tax=Bacillus sp. B15-48 TaxID=1548601 RepID=UPI00193F7DCF|nr:sulfite oxidase [Bacillus sp. B15-48]MBM4761975.1 molybdopterin-dependent oxidoreductase [Bacillus sp. B15-48]
MNRVQTIPFLTTRSLVPENQESPISFLNKWKTPLHYFYRRNHFTYPVLTPQNFWLQITGDAAKPRYFHYNELLTMPSKSIIVPIECAGNKRAHFSPKTYGEQWQDGAISQGKWTGVPLKRLLEQVEISKETKEVVFEGADAGKKTGEENVVPYKRSLPIEVALHPDTIIAYHYNNQPLNFRHGYPFRLIIPNWYGMASVKWLKSIQAIKRPFKGPFQTEDYIYYPYKNEDNDEDQFPVTILNVNSTIQQPIDRSILNTGTHQIIGIAWTGKGKIAEVQLSFDKGIKWETATLSSHPSEPYSWTKWSLTWTIEKQGEYTVYSRAKDSTGRIQPLTPFWNRKGYGYNAISKIKVKVE